MNDLWKPLGAFILALYFQVLVPSGISHRFVGVDFGEPTRDCAGRGQICKIDQLEKAGRFPPEAFGEAWLDSAATFHLWIGEAFWDAPEGESPDNLDLGDSLALPGSFRAPGEVFLSPGRYPGAREGGSIRFRIPAGTK